MHWVTYSSVNTNTASGALYLWLVNLAEQGDTSPSMLSDVCPTRTDRPEKSLLQSCLGRKTGTKCVFNGFGEPPSPCGTEA